MNYEDFTVGDIVGFYNNEDTHQTMLYIEKVLKIDKDYIKTIIIRCLMDRNDAHFFINRTQIYLKNDLELYNNLRLLTNLEKLKYL